MKDEHLVEGSRHGRKKAHGWAEGYIGEWAMGPAESQVEAGPPQRKLTLASQAMVVVRATGLEDDCMINKLQGRSDTRRVHPSGRPG